MAIEKSIKISSDVSGVTKGVAEISKAFKKLGEIKVGTNLKNKDVNNALKEQKEVIVSTQKEISRLSVELGKAMDDRKVKLLRDQIKGLKEDLKTSKNLIKDINAGGPGGGRSAPGASVGGGGGFGLSAGVIAGGAVLAASVITKAISSLITPSFEAAASRSRLRGLGVSQSQLGGIEQSGAGFGYGASDSRAQAESLLRGTGSASQLSSFQLLSRSTGIDIEQLMGVGGSLRNSGFSNKQSVQFIKDTLASAVAAGFDKSRSMDILSSIADKTEALAQNRSVNPNVIADLVTRTMSGSSYFQQNSGRSMSAINGLNSLYTGGGVGTGLAYQSLSQLYKGQNRSPIDLLYQTRQGLFNANDAPERISSYLGNLISLSTNKSVVGGGGVGQLSDDQLKNVTMTLTDIIKKSGGNISDDTSMEIIKGFLGKTGADRDKFLSEKAKQTESLEKQSLDFLKSTDNTLLKVDSVLEDIKLLISDGIVANLVKVINWLGLNDSTSTLNFAKRAAGSFSGDQSGAPKDYFDSTGNLLPGVKLDKNGNPYRESASSGGGNSGNYSAVASSTGGGASSSYPSQYRAIPDESLKKIGFNDKMISRFRQFDPYIVAAAQKYGVDANQLRAIVTQESSWNTGAKAFNKNVGLPGGQGLFQFIKSTGSMYGLSSEDRLDPAKASDAGARYLKDLMNRNHGNFSQAIKGYIDPRDVGWHDRNIVNKASQFSMIQSEANAAPIGMNELMAFAMQDLNKTLKNMQEKQKKEPVIKSDISNAARMSLNHSETISGK